MTLELGVSDTRIVGICLVRNEENFIAWSLMNVADFCDEIIVLDNGSVDRTPAVLAAVRARVPHLKVIEVEDAYDTHKYVEHLAGQNCWVFGVDGDEIYDPRGLARLRGRLLAGEFAHWWRLIGHTQHVTQIDWRAAMAFGYSQPAARSITKLYNFSAITRWPGPHQRLHGKTMKFRPGYSATTMDRIWSSVPWSQSDFRCLHMCFVPRSPVEQVAQGRPNPSERMKSRLLLRRAAEALGLRWLSEGAGRTYKERFYACGPIEAVEIVGFGRPGDWTDLNAQAGAIEELLLRRQPEAVPEVGGP